MECSNPKCGRTIIAAPVNGEYCSYKCRMAVRDSSGRRAAALIAQHARQRALSLGLMDRNLTISMVVDVILSARECYYCHIPKDGATQFHLEHKFPHARGGMHKLSNLAMACAQCNLIKGDRTEAEFVAYMRSEMLPRVRRIIGE